MSPFLPSVVRACLPRLFALACLLLASVATAYSSTLAGKVHNKANLPLPGVVVVLQGVAASTTTNAAGDFLLDYEQDAPVLTFRCVGYQTQTVLVRARGPVGITLYEVGTPLLPPAPGLELVIADGQLEVADEPPTFPGGVPAYRTYLQQNFHYPEEAKAKGLSGSVLVGFVVDEKGRILDAEVAKGCGAGLDEEALRLVRLMPWWEPGRREGKPVRVSSSLRIRFEWQQPATAP